MCVRGVDRLGGFVVVGWCGSGLSRFCVVGWFGLVILVVVLVVAGVGG